MFNVENLLCCCRGRCSLSCRGASCAPPTPPSTLPAPPLLPLDTTHPTLPFMLPTTLPNMLPSKFPSTPPSTISYRPYLPAPSASLSSPSTQRTQFSAPVVLPSTSKTLPSTLATSTIVISSALRAHCSSTTSDTLPPASGWPSDPHTRAATRPSTSTTPGWLPHRHNPSVLTTTPSENLLRSSSDFPGTTSHHHTPPISLTAAPTTPLPAPPQHSQWADTTTHPLPRLSPPASSGEQFSHVSNKLSPDCGYSSPEWSSVSPGGGYTNIDSRFSSTDYGGCPVLDCGHPRGAPPSFRSRVANSRPLSLRSPPSVGASVPVRAPVLVRSPVPVRAPVPVCVPLVTSAPVAVRGPLSVPSPYRLLSPLPVRDPLSVLNPLSVRGPLPVRGPLSTVPPPLDGPAAPVPDVNVRSVCPGGRAGAQGSGRDLTSPIDDRVTPLYAGAAHPCQRTCCSHPYSFPHPGMGYQMAGRCRRRGGQVRFTSDQSRRLEACFTSHKYITPPQRKVLARELDLQERQVMTWFQNRRAKLRRLRLQEEESQRQQQQQQQQGVD